MQHTLTEDYSDFVSDLPNLMAYYKPGMSLSRIQAYQDANFENLLTGLRTTLYDPTEHDFEEFPVVGFIPNKWNDVKVNLVDTPLDRVNILKNEEGICDVVLWQDHKPHYLSGASECAPED